LRLVWRVTGGGGQETELEIHSQALTTVDVDRVLGFEAATVSDWSIIQNGPGTLAASSTASQGSRSLAVNAHGYVPVQSVALSTLGSRVGSVIKYDIRLPTELAQISPSWYGLTQLYLEIPSLGLYNTFVGQAELTGKPLGQWITVSITPSPDILTKLRGSYSDLHVTVAVNAPYNNTKAYLIDNLRFSDKTLGVVTVLDGAGQPISGLTVTAYNGATPTSNTGVTDGNGIAKVWLPTGSYRFGMTDAGSTVFSSPSNQCQVPGVCPAATIIVKCHGVACNAQNTCQEAGVCDPGSGTCSYPAKPAGSVCRPSAGPCDLEETCDGTGGACPPDGFLQASLVCRPSSDDCDPAEICSGTSVACPDDAKAPDDDACDDGNPCTTDDKCQQGTCVAGTSMTCPVPDQCHLAGVCDPTSGTCIDTPKPDGTACAYSAACPDDDLCRTGSCMAGICRPCTSVTLTASKSYDPDETTDGEQAFDSPAVFMVPGILHVIEGLSGNGTASLTITPAMPNTSASVTCTYQGASSQAHPSTPEERAMAGFYVFQSCDAGVVAGQKMLIDHLQLHVDQGDSLAGPTAVQHVVSCPENQSASDTEIPPDSNDLLPGGWPGLPFGPGDPQPDPPKPPPLPFVPGSNPEVDGIYVPVADPSIVFVER
jgi:hypothetical protein